MLDLDARLGSLEQAIGAATDRLDTELLENANSVFAHASERLRLSADHTVVVLGGATGSGKSSMFNAISGLELAEVGYLRPTTAEALACAWGPVGATELLDWIGVPKRNQIMRRSQLDNPVESDFEGLVLVDLPDHDSVIVDNKLVVDQLVERADLFIWVLDPQKYADAAIHDQYLEPLATHRDTTIVVLNQIDRLAVDDRKIALDDLRRILDREGLAEVPLMATSSVTGDGMDALRQEIIERIQSKQTHRERLVGDVRAAAEGLKAAGGSDEAPGIQAGHRDKLLEIFGVCLGVEQMADAVEDSMLRRAAVATDWPIFGMFGRLRRDPLKAVGLGRSVRDVVASKVAMTPSVQRSRAELVMREVAESSVAGLNRPWRSAILEKVTGEGARDVIDELDLAVADVDLGVDQRRWWWSLVGLFQWLSMLATIAGVIVFGLRFVPGWSPDGWDFWPSPLGFPLEGWLAVGGLVLGLLLTVFARFLGAWSARRTAMRFERRVSDAIERTTDEKVLARLQEELDRYERYRTGVVAASA